MADTMMRWRKRILTVEMMGGVQHMLDTTAAWRTGYIDVWGAGHEQGDRICDIHWLGLSTQDYVRRAASAAPPPGSASSWTAPTRYSASTEWGSVGQSHLSSLLHYSLSRILQDPILKWRLHLAPQFASVLSAVLSSRNHVTEHNNDFGNTCICILYI